MKIADIIEYMGDNSTFVWRHPCDDFNTGTKLIVHESQEAVFFLNGQALDLFGAGVHTLETQNVPMLKHILNIGTAGKTSFKAEVYFINKIEQMSIKWGTDSRVQYIEPTYKFPISIGASGELSLSVEDSRKLLVKLVGVAHNLSRETLVAFFRSFLMTRIKTYIAQEMKNQQLSIFEIDEHLSDFSDSLLKRLKPDFSDYGVCLNKILVNNFVRPEGEEQYERFKNLYFEQSIGIKELELKQRQDLIKQETEAKKVVIEAQGFAQKRSLEGYTYQQERGFDVAQDLAQSPASSGSDLTKLGIELGLMGSVGNIIGGTVKQVVTGAFVQNKIDKIFCQNCGIELSAEDDFCSNCGQKVFHTEICSKCGYVFTKSGNFCPKCGMKRITNEIK